METLTDIPFSLDTSSLLEPLRIVPDSEDAEALDEMVGLARRVGRPKTAYREVFLGAKTEDTVSANDVTFTSRMLAQNLESIERVFAYVATCGREVHEAFPENTGDFMREYWWDTIKNQLLAAASQHLSDHLHTTYRLGKTATMHPGSGDANVWPIQQQQPLFALLGDVQGEIGVELTDSFLMTPNKTISGIRFPSEHDFRSCQVCHREDCPGRSAAFDEAVWRQTQHE